MTIAARTTPTWAALAAAEPALAALLADARAVRDTRRRPSFCANAVWYDRFKPRLVALVGWGRAGDPLLGTSDSYDVAYATVYRALPNCRNCGCA
jgi:hypothetical protein